MGTALRLRSRVRKLDGWLECGEEGMVLPKQRQGLPTSSRRMRLSRPERESTVNRAQLQHAGAFASSSSGCSAILLSRSSPENDAQMTCTCAKLSSPMQPIFQIVT